MTKGRDLEWSDSIAIESCKKWVQNIILDNKLQNWEVRVMSNLEIRTSFLLLLDVKRVVLLNLYRCMKELFAWFFCDSVFSYGSVPSGKEGCLGRRVLECKEGREGSVHYRKS